MFSLIGKPVYWLLLSPLLLYLFLKKRIEYILHYIDTTVLDFFSQRATVPPKRKKPRTAKKRTSPPSPTQTLWASLHERMLHTWGWIRTRTLFSVSLRFAKKSTKSRRQRSPHTRRSFFHHLRYLGALVLVVSLVSLSVYGFYIAILKDLPTPQDLLAHQPIVTTKIYDRHGVLLYKIYKDENRSVVSLEQIAQTVKDATIAIEDKEFYSHHGISLRAIARVIKLAVTQQRFQGGSTITQQLVKNTLLTRERTITRKLKEMILAVQVEQVLSKDQILEMYLNNVSYGGSVYGIEEAAQKYFQTTASNLTLAQASFLAALPAAPSIYSPVGPNAQLALERQHEVLRQLTEDGKISPLESEVAKSQPIVIAPDATNIKAPHFVMYIRDVLAKKYGEELVSQGGLEVITTLDYDLQQQVEKIVADEVAHLASLRVSNGAALVTNPATGEILSMVGSHNYFDIKNDGQVNVTTRLRQPGSSIKPILYSAALERGFTPATLIDDSPVVYHSRGSPPYAPKNYDGQFHGLESLRKALANSHNVPAVKTEAAIGLPAFISAAKRMGITSWEDSSRFGLSLTLGSGEVLMTDMATAYGVLANQGKRMDLNPLLEVKTYTGKVLYENLCSRDSAHCSGTQVLDPRVAFQITDILSDNLARSSAFGLTSVLHIPGHQVAVKTGTTNNLRDNWTLGYTKTRVVAAWVGNNDNRPMSQVTSGITGASPIWNKIMQLQLDKERPHAFTIPSNLEARTMCSHTSQPSCDHTCRPTYTEYFLPGTAPKVQCAPDTTATVPTTPLPRSTTENKQASIAYPL